MKKVKKGFRVLEWLEKMRAWERAKTREMTPREYAEYEEAKSLRLEEQQLWERAVEERLFALDDAQGTPGVWAATSGEASLKRQRRMRRRLNREMQGLAPAEQRERVHALARRLEARLGLQPVGLTPEERQGRFHADMDFHATCLSVREAGGLKRRRVRGPGGTWALRHLPWRDGEGAAAAAVPASEGAR